MAQDDRDALRRRQGGNGIGHGIDGQVPLDRPGWLIPGIADVTGQGDRARPARVIRFNALRVTIW